MQQTRRDAILGGLALAALPRMARSASGPDTTGGSAFGSTWRLVSVDPLPAGARRWIERRIAAVDAAMSPYRAGSALSRFNRAPVGTPVPIPAAMSRVIRTALTMHGTTQGAFDPTVGPVVHRFGFGPIAGQSGAGVAGAIDLREETVLKSTPGVTLDLCGIAKGFALDELFDGLIARGARNMLLELGGELRAVGRHPSGRPWHVAIEDPLAPGFAAHTIVAPGRLALATSGHRANGIFGDRPISHVIAPDTARPAVGFAASVSVLASTGIAADAWATALLAMGPRGPMTARAHAISALFILDRDAGGSVMTGGFAAHVVA